MFHVCIYIPTCLYVYVYDAFLCINIDTAASANFIIIIIAPRESNGEKYSSSSLHRRALYRLDGCCDEGREVLTG